MPLKISVHSLGAHVIQGQKQMLSTNTLLPSIPDGAQLPKGMKWHSLMHILIANNVISTRMHACLPQGLSHHLAPRLGTKFIQHTTWCAFLLRAVACLLQDLKTHRPPDCVRPYELPECLYKAVNFLAQALCCPLLIAAAGVATVPPGTHRGSTGTHVASTAATPITIANASTTAAQPT
eukprot:1148904-Pelagomonas_calceolata.AAC.7